MVRYCRPSVHLARPARPVLAQNYGALLVVLEQPRPPAATLDLDTRAVLIIEKPGLDVFSKQPHTLDNPAAGRDPQQAVALTECALDARHQHAPDLAALAHAPGLRATVGQVRFEVLQRPRHVGYT